MKIELTEKEIDTITFALHSASDNWKNLLKAAGDASPHLRALMTEQIAETLGVAQKLEEF